MTENPPAAATPAAQDQAETAAAAPPSVPLSAGPPAEAAAAVPGDAAAARCASGAVPADSAPADGAAVQAAGADGAAVQAAGAAAGPGTPDPAPADDAAACAGGADPAPVESLPAAGGTPDAAEPDEDALRLAEALVFASAGPVSARALSQLLPDTQDADAVIAALRARYAGRGVELVDTAGGVQFRTAAELAPRLRKVIEVPRKLPRVAMETLAIIAYHQPCTRAEVEEIRGTSLSQQTLDALLEANLVAPKGRREVPGRPTLWGTTPEFLALFGLRDIRDLPQRADLLLEPPRPSGVSAAPPLRAEMTEPLPSGAEREQDS